MTGRRNREEVALDIDKGKTLIVRQTGRSDTLDEEGRVKAGDKVGAKDLLVEIA